MPGAGFFIVNRYDDVLFVLNHPDIFSSHQPPGVQPPPTPALIPNFVEEALRSESPVQGLTRLAKIDTEIGGVKIPAGSLIFVMFASGNRDEAQYKDAAGFDLRRENARTHLSFGQGVHFCLGAALARLEGKVAFETLLARLRNIRFAPAGNDFTHTPSFILRGLRALHIEFDRA